MQQPYPSQIVLIAGRGDYPALTIRAARERGVERIEVIAFKGETRRKDVDQADQIHWVPLGGLSALKEVVRQIGIPDGLFVGQVAPRHIFNLHLDAAAKALLQRLPVVNTHSILHALIDELTACGMRMLPAHLFLQEHMPNAGGLTQAPISKQQRADAQIGMDYIRSQSRFDVGQTVVVKAGYILAVEAVEGTDRTLLRAAKYGGKGAVVVKMPKEGHDERFDIPVIGLKTIKVMRRIGAQCLVVQAKGCLILILRVCLSLQMPLE